MKAILFKIICLILFAFLIASCGKEQEKHTVKQEPAAISVDRLTNMGNEQWRMGNYQDALSYFNQAYTAVKNTGDEKQKATLLNNLGLVHWRLENNTAAMECYLESAKLAEKLNMDRLLGLTCTNRALILKEQRNFKSAFVLNNKAIAIFKDLKEPHDLAIAYNNQGQIYRYGDKPEQALRYYRLSLNECKKVGYTEGMATAYQNLSTVYTIQGNAKQATASARKCLMLSLEGDSKVRISEAYLELSRIHEKFGQPDSALYYYKNHYDREKELLEANQSDLLSRYQANLGVEVKNLRIQNLQKEKQLAGNRLWLIATGILTLVMAVGFFVYRHLAKLKFRKQQLEQELENSKQLIEVKEQELKAYIVDLSRKNTIIARLQEEAVTEAVLPDNEPEVAKLLEQKILTDDDWENFKDRFDNIYPRFFIKIKESNYQLTEAEVRILVLMRLELNGKDMANILGISPQSVRVCKMRLKKKLAPGFETVEDYLRYIIR